MSAEAPVPAVYTTKALQELAQKIEEEQITFDLDELLEQQGGDVETAITQSLVNIEKLRVILEQLPPITN